MAVSLHKGQGTQCKPQYTIILKMGTPKKGTPNFGNYPNQPLYMQAGAEHFEQSSKCLEQGEKCFHAGSPTLDRVCNEEAEHQRHKNLSKLTQYKDFAAQTAARRLTSMLLKNSHNCCNLCELQRVDGAGICCDCELSHGYKEAPRPES